MAEKFEKTFNDVSGGIDRFFRTVEMMGITALVGVLVTSYGHRAVSTVMAIGTTLAVIYLTEPAMNSLGYYIIRKKGKTPGVFLSFIAMIVWLNIINAAAPYLAILPLRIAKTISMAS